MHLLAHGRNEVVLGAGRVRAALELCVLLRDEDLRLVLPRRRAEAEDGRGGHRRRDLRADGRPVGVLTRTGRRIPGLRVEVEALGGAKRPLGRRLGRRRDLLAHRALQVVLRAGRDDRAHLELGVLMAHKDLLLPRARAAPKAVRRRRLAPGGRLVAKGRARAADSRHASLVGGGKGGGAVGRTEFYSSSRPSAAELTTLWEF